METLSLHTPEQRARTKITLFTTRSMPALRGCKSDPIFSKKEPQSRNMSSLNTRQPSKQESTVAMQLQDEQWRLHRTTSPSPSQLPPLPASPTPKSRSASPSPNTSTPSSSTSLVPIVSRASTPLGLNEVVPPTPHLPSQTPIHNRIRALNPTPRALSPPRRRKTPVLINAPTITWPQQQHQQHQHALLHPMSSLSSLASSSSVSTTTATATSSSFLPRAPPSPPPTIPSIYERNIRYTPTRLSTVTEASHPGFRGVDTGPVFMDEEEEKDGQEQEQGQEEQHVETDVTDGVQTRMRRWGNVRIRDVVVVVSGGGGGVDGGKEQSIQGRSLKDTSVRGKKEAKMKEKNKLVRWPRRVCRKVGGCFGVE